MVLELFEKDPDTSAMILLGETGGDMEIEAASVIRGMKKPVFSYLAGMRAPLGRRMGHAGAIAGESDETAEAKSIVLNENGAHTARTVGDLLGQVRTFLRA
jgi:succinyl-CoA synthetase alpha subunit